MRETVFAQRTQRMGASAIREILKAASRPGMISLAGGIPSPEAIPVEIMSELTGQVFTKYGTAALQYDRTEGFEPLRIALSNCLRDQKGIQAEPKEILIASGSQGVLDSLGKILISPGDRVAVEAPTYLGAIQAFNPYMPEYVGLDTDAEGLVPESLEDAVRGGPVKLVYLAPTFQNPTGRTLSLSRRQRLAEIIDRHGLLIVEDDPYGDLRYRGQGVPPLQTFIPERVVYVGSLSKVFAPGLRTGYCIAPESIRRWLVLAKQGVDLHTSTLCQALAAEYIEGGYLQRHLPTIIARYRPRLYAMLNAMDDHFPLEVNWSRPEGGMFIWVEGPPSLDAETLYLKALKKGVAVVPGKYFFTNSSQGANTMRMNFTRPDESSIRWAIEVLAGLLTSSSHYAKNPVVYHQCAKCLENEDVEQS